VNYHNPNPNPNTNTKYKSNLRISLIQKKKGSGRISLCILAKDLAEPGFRPDPDGFVKPTHTGRGLTDPTKNPLSPVMRYVSSSRSRRPSKSCRPSSVASQKERKKRERERERERERCYLRQLGLAVFVSILNNLGEKK
jgi:hypothetical protein